MDMNDHAEQEIAQLDFWKGGVSLEPIGGGITNRNFVATDQGHKYFVRMGNDIPLHGVMRFNELQASRAAAGVREAVLGSAGCREWSRCTLPHAAVA